MEDNELIRKIRNASLPYIDSTVGYSLKDKKIVSKKTEIEFFPLWAVLSSLGFQKEDITMGLYTQITILSKTVVVPALVADYIKLLESKLQSKDKIEGTPIQNDEDNID